MRLVSNKISFEELFSRLKTKGFELIKCDNYTNTTSSIATCICQQCGRTFSNNVHNLLYRSKSCGCRRKQLYKTNKGNTSVRWNGHGEISSKKWYAYKSNACKRGIEFNIKIEDAWNQFMKQDKRCAISNLDLTFDSTSKKCDGNASLDRIDSSVGYEKDNIQWIHKDIQNMKWNLPEDKFLTYCELVLTPQINNSINDSCTLTTKNYNFNGCGNLSLTKFNQLKHGAEKRNIQFSVSIEELWEMFLQQHGYCKLTGLPIYFKYKHDSASLDRIDSSKGYSLNNVQWVHKDVNKFIKNKLNELDMIMYCQLIVNNPLREV